MTYDQITDWARILTVIIGLFAFIALVITTWATIKANREREARNNEQKERIEQLKNDTAKLEKEVAEAKTKQAQAEAALIELTKLSSNRTFSTKKFIELLKGKYDGVTVKILYRPNDAEARWLAIQLHNVLGKPNISLGENVVGWDVSEPIPIPPDFEKEFGRNVDTLEGVLVVHNAKSWFPFEDTYPTPGGALQNAIYLAGLGSPSAWKKSSYPDNFCLVIVGEKPKLFRYEE